ncbi:ROK family transcriptional regulator [Brucella cytisi]|uniref:ROK family transcriptional regulator n=1 Tax=Brucella cytisi TaxID=407152 RepID=UPI00313AAE78
MAQFADVSLIEVPKLTASARAVFRTLARNGSATRPELAERLGLSRPTMSIAMEDLERLGYVEMTGVRQRGTGRKAVMYRLGPEVGHIIAVDAGSTNVRLTVSTFDNRILYSGGYHLGADQRRFTPELEQAVAQGLRDVRQATQDSWGPLRSIGIALPTKVEHQIASSEEISALYPHISRSIEALNIPVILENNVNCAAIAEGAFGNATHASDFVYIQVGVKIGMGIVLCGELVRGRNGGAGEISSLPFPWSPDIAPNKEALEDYLGSESLMQRVLNEWPAGEAPPKDAPALFALAQNGHGIARSHVDRHADDVGRLVAACVSVLDPGLVILGGGIGHNAQILPKVRDVVNHLSGPTQIEVTGLGVEATLKGIQRLTLRCAEERLIGENAE